MNSSGTASGHFFFRSRSKICGRTDGRTDALARSPHRPLPSRPALTSKAVSSSRGAMLASGMDSAWLMTPAALDTSGW